MSISRPTGLLNDLRSEQEIFKLFLEELGIVFDGGSGGSGGSIGQDQFTPQQIRYVYQNGSDVSGDGTSGKPWITFAHALNSIVDAGPEKKYVIMCSGDYENQPQFNLKPYITIIGTSVNSTRIATLGNIGLDQSFSTALGTVRCGLVNVWITGPFSQFNVDLQSIGGNGPAKIELINTRFEGLVAWKGRAGCDGFNSWNSIFISGMVASGGQMYHQGLYSSDDIVSNADGALPDFFQHEFVNIYMPAGNYSISTPDGYAGNGQAMISGVVSGTLDVSGPNLSFTAPSNIIKSTTLTLSRGAELYRQGDAFGVAYIPKNPSDWSTAPDNVLDALDRMASLLRTLSEGNPIP